MMRVRDLIEELSVLDPGLIVACNGHIEILDVARSEGGSVSLVIDEHSSGFCEECLYA